MIADFFVPFFTVGVAELGDKTQLAMFCLSSKTHKHFELILGALLAFIIADGLAILLGDYITTLIPLSYIKMGSGLLFIAFGLSTILSKEEKGESCKVDNPFLSSFSIMLLSEFGDKTQILSGVFATKYNPVLVFAGVITVLTILAALAVYAGKFLLSRVPKKTLSLAAGGLFIVLGILSFV